MSKEKIFIEENKMKIEIFFVYPMMKIVNGESNLFRIVDNELKETLVIYLIKEKDKYNINMIKTITGETNNIFIANNLLEVYNLNSILNNNKDKIMNGKDLYSAEQYILNFMKC